MLNEYRKILVTGGRGFIGSHLVDALVSMEKDVIVFDNLSRIVEAPPPTKATFIRGDIRESGQIGEALTGVDLVFHAAANANGTLSVLNPWSHHETNALGTFKMLDAARQADVKKFIYVSSASVYGAHQPVPITEHHPTSPFIPYGVSKLMGEKYCELFLRIYGLSVSIARPFCVYGPREHPEFALVEVSRYLRWHLHQQSIRVVGDLDRKIRDFVHISDVVKGLLLIADKAEAGAIVNIGSGEGISMRHLIDVISAATGRSAEVKVIADVTEDTYRLVADISKLTSLGYIPRVSIAEGVERLAQDLGAYPGLPSGETIFKAGQCAEAQVG